MKPTRNGVPVAGGQLDVMVRQAQEALAVAESRQIVDQRQVAQSELQPLALHRVAQRAPQRVLSTSALTR